MASNQLPQGVPFVDKRNMVDYRWVAVLSNITSSIPPAGVGFVTDGSGLTYAPMILFQGLDSAKGGDPETGSLYFALDTGKIYFATGGEWYFLSPEYVGDVTKPVGSNEMTLATVNAAIGTWGDQNNYPVITVNEKGLVTNVTLESISTAGGVPGGTIYSIQYNDNGTFNGDNTFYYNPTTDTMFVTNALVNGQIQFFNPIPTRTNLLPVQTGKAGQVLTTNGTDVLWGDAGTFEMLFNFGDATPKNLMIIPANKIIQDVSIVLMTAFNAASTLSVGDAGNVNRLLATGDNTTSEAGTYTTEPAYKYAVDTQLTLSITPGATTQGNGLIVITYQK